MLRNLKDKSSGFIVMNAEKCLLRLSPFPFFVCVILLSTKHTTPNGTLYTILQIINHLNTMGVCRVKLMIGYKGLRLCQSMESVAGSWLHIWLSNDDLPSRGNLSHSHKGYKHQTVGNSQPRSNIGSTF